MNDLHAKNTATSAEQEETTLAGLVRVTSLACASMWRTLVIRRPCPFQCPIASTNITATRVVLIIMVFLSFVKIPLSLLLNLARENPLKQVKKGLSRSSVNYPSPRPVTGLAAQGNTLLLSPKLANSPPPASKRGCRPRPGTEWVRKKLNK